MNPRSIWESYYAKTPLEKIPWYYTQADYFVKLLNSGKLGKGKALDLGCGVGKKSILLSKKKFSVTGIDISPTAIYHANKNAKKEGTKIRFIVADTTDLSFLRNKKFDFVLDWANLHGIPKSKRKRYIREIAEYTKQGGKLLLRCFSKYRVKKELGFLSPVGMIYLFSREDIEKLFGNYFRTLETNRSKPRDHPGKWFDEYLMERM